ncbi:protein phosphatase 1 regulatory subunit 35 [Chanos chanos]|uniref:Protein phosphatase 1 regulatory subunit 35 n=1 Tax=Chanos chanos TaxID=29144 RepID=A0A6J2VDB0_CHACN|nr:protein phosphatase 1 regulatory subunit 35 [Chanos chanos]
MISTNLRCPSPVPGDPDIRPAPQPVPAPVCHGTPLKCPDLDLSITLTPEHTVNRGRRQKLPGKQVRFDVSPKSRIVASSPRKAYAMDQTVVVSVTAEPNSNQKSAELRKCQYSDKAREDKGKLIQGQRTLSEQSDSSDGQVLEGAELNTTLALKAELKELEEAEFDSKKAVKEKMKTSALAKNHITAKATEGLNFPRSQHLYRALVSVTLSHDQLVSQALRDRPALTPPTRGHGSKVTEAPDLLAFYSPAELFREIPLLPGDQLPLPRPQLVPRPTHTTFDLYHRHRQWEA